MKLLRRLLTLITITSVLYSCESDKDSKIFFSELQNVDTLSVFTGKLAELGLKEDSPYTVFALSNSSITSTKSGISTEQINNHVFSGAFSLSELTNGKKLTSINGKEFKIKEFNNSKYINNSKIDKHIGSFGNSQFFSVSELILEESDNTKSLEITVYDYSSCSKSNLTPTVCENAVVKIYNTTESFNDNKPLTQAKTDKNGVAIFYNLKSGDYRILVEKGELRNIKKGYIIDGIFKSKDEINIRKEPYAQIGDLKLYDLNGDGIITHDDKIKYQPVKYEGELVKKNISIASPKPSLYDYYQQSDKSISYFRQFMEEYYLFQSIISKKYTDHNNKWNNIANGNFTASDENISYIWTLAYNTINYSTSLLKEIPEISQLSDERKQISSASIRVLRGLVYLQCKNIWGEIPIVSEAFEKTNPKSSLSDLSIYISTEMDDAINNIGDNDLGITANKELALTILTRLFLIKKDYMKAIQYAEQIINSGKLSLASSDDIFNSYSSEAIYSFTKKGNSEFNNFFVKGTHISVARYTEVLLLAAECRLQTGDLMKATMYMNMIQQRSGKPAIQTMNSQELLNKMNNLWDEELNREGWEFTWLKYRGIAATELNIPEQNLVMPIPQSVIDNNSNITQNPGY